jgi:hypothetical protein
MRAPNSEDHLYINIEVIKLMAVEANLAIYTATGSTMSNAKLKFGCFTTVFYSLALSLAEYAAQYLNEPNRSSHGLLLHISLAVLQVNSSYLTLA